MLCKKGVGMDVISLLLLLTAFAYTFYATAKFIINNKRKRTMKRREQQLKDEGISPYGSSLSNRMYVDKEGQINSDQKASLIWYKRLLQESQKQLHF